MYQIVFTLVFPTLTYKDSGIVLKSHTIKNALHGYIILHYQQ